LAKKGDLDLSENLRLIYLENKLYLISINLTIPKNQPQLPEIPGLAKRTSPPRLLWRGSNDGQAVKTGSCFFWVFVATNVDQLVESGNLWKFGVLSLERCLIKAILKV